MKNGEGPLPQRPCRPNRIEREVKGLPDEGADKNDAKIDPQAQKPDDRQRLPFSYERRYFMQAAIASTRNTMTRSQISPMPNIMPVGIVDISIIMNPVALGTQVNRRVTHSRPGGFTATIGVAEKRLGQRPRQTPHIRTVSSSPTNSAWDAGAAEDSSLGRSIPPIIRWHTPSAPCRPW